MVTSPLLSRLRPSLLVSALLQHVDLFPTLAEAAIGKPLDRCPEGDASFEVPLCTEGSSLVPLMKDPSTPVKNASFR